jgi:hypothetical protein
MPAQYDPRSSRSAILGAAHAPLPNVVSGPCEIIEGAPEEPNLVLAAS